MSLATRDVKGGLAARMTASILKTGTSGFSLTTRRDDRGLEWLAKRIWKISGSSSTKIRMKVMSQTPSETVKFMYIVTVNAIYSTQKPSQSSHRGVGGGEWGARAPRDGQNADCSAVRSGRQGEPL